MRPPSRRSRHALFLLLLLLLILLVASINLAAIPLPPLGPVSPFSVFTNQDPPSQQQQQQPQLEEQPPLPPLKDIHYVYSVGCGGHSMSEWQLTQALILDFSWERSLATTTTTMQRRRKEYLTRIVSGCEGDLVMRQLMRRTSLKDTSRFSVRFVPRNDVVAGSKGKGKPYVQLNRPYALLNFFTEEGFLKSEGSDHKNDTVYAVLDPDFAFREDLSQDIVDHVKDSHPLGALYFIGHNWVIHAAEVCREAFGKSPFSLNNGSEIMTTCDEVLARLDQLSTSRFKSNRSKYETGVPYLLTRNDWLKLLPVWIKIIPSMYRHYDDISSDMHAYALASFMIDLPHQIHSNFMTTCMRSDDPDVDPFVDSIWLHYCQHYVVPEIRDERYHASPAKAELTEQETKLCKQHHNTDYVYVFNKHWLKNLRTDKYPHLIDCACPLLVGPPENIEEKDLPIPKTKKGLQVSRFIVPLINDMLVQYKQKYCIDVPMNLSKLLITHETHRNEWGGRLNHAIGEPKK